MSLINKKLFKENFFLVLSKVILVRVIGELSDLKVNLDIHNKQD